MLRQNRLGHFKPSLTYTSLGVAYVCTSAVKLSGVFVPATQYQFSLVYSSKTGTYASGAPLWYIKLERFVAGKLLKPSITNNLPGTNSLAYFTAELLSLVGFMPCLVHPVRQVSKHAQVKSTIMVKS